MSEWWMVDGGWWMMIVYFLIGQGVCANRRYSTILTRLLRGDDDLLDLNGSSPVPITY